ncbi:hypothetical protein O6H91_21G036600 [Diphasiastrum complanatum]|uniref:Uncharacterized protein n=1 Tax=Diphasiastrum complanatum TaxID=34168 RepID=A0ACC2AJE8_DIPCM|nr:hypothetical protein O6H91_21G036600 [Diphasiastrum complanatum]
MAEYLKYLVGWPGPSGFGSRTTAEEVTADLDLTSHTVLITGATSGLGLETARVLAKRGAHVIIPGRKLQSSKKARDFILKEHADARVSVGELDLSSLASIRKFVDDLKSQNYNLNTLINNAGVTNAKYICTKDGLQLDFATNHVGHFLLTNLLLDNIIATAKKYGIEGRIVIVSSNAHFLTKALDLKTVNDENSFQWFMSYGKSKLANILHAKELARRLKEKSVNVTANALHPGGVRTNILRDLNATFATVLLFMVSWAFKTVPQGAATTCYLAAHPTVAGVSGKYFCDCNEYECSSYANDMKLAADLWAYSEGITSSYMD